MKKNRKLLCLAGALALCLLLTGCYQPPDQVNNGQQTGAGTSALFDTLAPTATVETTPADSSEIVPKGLSSSA